VDAISFSKAALVADLTEHARARGGRAQNGFVRILVERGVILEDGVATSEARAVVLDIVYCDPDEKRINAFVEEIQQIGEVRQAEGVIAARNKTG